MTAQLASPGGRVMAAMAEHLLLTHMASILYQHAQHCTCYVLSRELDNGASISRCLQAITASMHSGSAAV